MKGRVTKTGYLDNSPDRFNDYNVILGENITMEGVSNPIVMFPIKNNKVGNPVQGVPGENYYFPGADGVLEMPIPSGTMSYQRMAKGGSSDAKMREVLSNVAYGKGGNTMTPELAAKILKTGSIYGKTLTASQKSKFAELAATIGIDENGDPIEEEEENRSEDVAGYKKGGVPKSKKKHSKTTSKNIFTAINEIFARNTNLYGSGGKEFYKPELKDGGWLDQYQIKGEVEPKTRTVVHTDKTLFDKAYKAENDSVAAYNRVKTGPGSDLINAYYNESGMLFDKDSYKKHNLVEQDFETPTHRGPIPKDNGVTIIYDQDFVKIGPEKGDDWYNEVNELRKIAHDKLMSKTKLKPYWKTSPATDLSTNETYLAHAIPYWKKPVIHNIYQPPVELPKDTIKSVIKDTIKPISVPIKSSQNITRQWNFAGTNPVLEYRDASGKIIKTETYNNAGPNRKLIEPIIIENQSSKKAEEKAANKKHGGSLKKYQAGDQVVNLSNQFIYPEQINRFANDALQNRALACQGPDCLAGANTYYNKYVAPKFGLPNTWKLNELYGIVSGDPNQPYGTTADSWDLAALMQAKGAIQNYAAPLYEDDKKTRRDYKDAKRYWNLRSDEEKKNLYSQMALGTLVNFGDYGGLAYGERLQGSNEKAGLYPSRHSARVVGFTESGVPVIYDYGHITRIDDPVFDFPITNVTTPKELAKYNYQYVKDWQDKNKAKLDYDPKEKLLLTKASQRSGEDPFTEDELKYVEGINKNIANLMRITGASQDDIIKAGKVAFGIMEGETRGGRGAPKAKGKEFVKAAFDPFSILSSEPSKGLTRIKPEMQAGDETNKYSQYLKALGLNPKDIDLWDPEQAALATTALILSRKGNIEGVDKWYLRAQQHNTPGVGPKNTERLKQADKDYANNVIQNASRLYSTKTGYGLPETEEWMTKKQSERLKKEAEESKKEGAKALSEALKPKVMASESTGYSPKIIPISQLTKKEMGGESNWLDEYDLPKAQSGLELLTVDNQSYDPRGKFSSYTQPGPLAFVYPDNYSEENIRNKPVTKPAPAAERDLVTEPDQPKKPAEKPAEKQYKVKERYQAFFPNPAKISTKAITPATTYVSGKEQNTLSSMPAYKRLLTQAKAEAEAQRQYNTGKAFLNIASFIPGTIGLGANISSGAVDLAEGDYGQGTIQGAATVLRNTQGKKAQAIKGLSNLLTAEELYDFNKQPEPSYGNFLPYLTDEYKRELFKQKPLTVQKDGGWLDQYPEGGEKPWGEMTPKERAAYLDTKEKQKPISKYKADVIAKNEEEKSREQAKKEYYKDYVVESTKKTLEHPIFNTAQYFTPEGMAIGSIKGLANLGPDISKGDYKSAAFDVLSASPVIASSIKNIYKINPWAFKPNPEAYYRGVGKEGMEDIFESGVIRSKKQNAYPEPYFSKGIIGDKYAKGYFTELTNEPMKGVGSFSTGDLIQTPVNTVGINNPNLKLYKQDWLRGYTEIPKTKKAYGGDPSLANIEGHYQKGGAQTPEEWEKEIRAVEHKIGDPKKWSQENYQELQDKLNEYKAWRENTPEGRAVIDYHNEPNEYVVFPPAHLNKEKYNMKRALELGYQPDEGGHWPSVDYESGEYLKSKKHPTAWMEYLYGYTLNPEQAANYNVRVNPEGYFGEDQLQYILKEHFGGQNTKTHTHMKEGGWLDEYQTKGEVASVAESTSVLKPQILKLPKDINLGDKDRTTLNYMYARDLLKKYNVDIDSTGNVLDAMGLNSGAYYNPVTRTIHYKSNPKQNPKIEYSSKVMHELPHAIQSDSMGVLPFLKNTFAEGIQDYLFNDDKDARYHNISKIEGHAHNILQDKLYRDRNKYFEAEGKHKLGGWLEDFE